MIKKVFLFEHGLVPAEAVGLGRLITNLRQPNVNYHNPSIDWPLTETPHTSFNQLITSDRSFKLRGELTKLLTGISTDSSDHQIAIHGESARQRTLDNPRDFWEKARQNERTREWVNKTVKVYKEDIYLIIGAYTVTNPSYMYSSSYVHSVGATGGFSGANAMGLAAASGVTGSVGSLGGEGSVHSTGSASQKRSYEAQGEMAYAVQCQRLRTRRFIIFKESRAEKVELKQGTRWYEFRATNVSGENQSPAVDTTRKKETGIEADLDDENWDFEKENDGEGWHKVVVGGEEFMFPQDDESSEEDVDEDEEEDE